MLDQNISNTYHKIAKFVSLLQIQILTQIDKLFSSIPKMITEIAETTSSIKSQIAMIEENRKQRNQIYQTSMDNYLNNLKNQIQLLQSTENLNIQRNNTISHAFEIAYDKILTSSNITIRKIKQTLYQKELFWQNLIKNSAALNSIDLKKQFYIQKRDAQERYQEAINQQNAKKIPYSVLLGKNKKKSQLQEWKQNNRVFQDKVNQGTTILNNWKSNWEKQTYDTQERLYRPTAEIFENISPHHFIRTASEKQLSTRIPNYESKQNNKFSSPKQAYDPTDNVSDFGFLRNFEKRKYQMQMI